MRDLRIRLIGYTWSMQLPENKINLLMDKDKFILGTLWVHKNIDKYRDHNLFNNCKNLVFKILTNYNYPS